MPAYSFKPQFVEPIRAGTKGGTIRAGRRPSGAGLHADERQAKTGGHAYIGDLLSLYCQQRSPHGFLISRVKCCAVEPILLDFAGDGRIVFGDGRTMHYLIALDAFAQFDGFAAWSEMMAFWRSTHGVDHFRGWHVRWLPLPAFRSVRVLPRRTIGALEDDLVGR